jgi:hypothetical protein
MFGVTRDSAVAGIKSFFAVFGLYIGWVVIHYAASHFYIHWCVPATVLGFIMSPFVVPAPHCQALRWAIYNGGNSIVAMWVLLGIWFMKMFKVVNV